MRFTSETDQQLALVEMNKVKLKGKEMILKLATPKSRGRDSRPSRHNYSNSSHSSNISYSDRHSGRNWYQSSRSYRRSRSPQNRRPATPVKQRKNIPERKFYYKFIIFYF